METKLFQLLIGSLAIDFPFFSEIMLRCIALCFSILIELETGGCNLRGCARGRAMKRKH